MADVSIYNAISSRTARGSRGAVFTTDQIGYWFYIETTTAGFYYRKTTDGGASWGSGVRIGPAVAADAFDVWYDQWTPGDSGTLIHTWHFEATADDVIWRTLDTSTDTLGTSTVAFTGATVVAGRGVFVSGTKTTSGYLYAAYELDAGAERGLLRSTDGGANWSEISTDFVEASLDTCLLFPAPNTGDGNDCLALYSDSSVDAITLKLWDSSGAVASESATIATVVDNTTDLTGQNPYAASIRHSDGKIIAAMVTEFDTATSDHRVFELDCTAPGTFAITELAAVTTNIDDHYYPAVFVDQTTGDLYVAYNGARGGTETLGTSTKVYYTKSTDDGATWSAGDTAYMEGSAAAVVQIWAPLMGPRFYVGWRVGNTLNGNEVNSLTFAAGFTGTGSLAVPRPGLASTGLVSFIGAAALAVSVALSGSGAVTGPPTGTGSLAVTAPALASSGTNQQQVTGTGALAVLNPSLAATGINALIGTGTLAVQPSLSGTGTNQQQVTSTGSLAVPAPTFTASGGQGDFRSGSATLAVAQPSVSASGTTQSQFAGTASLAVAPSLSGSGQQQNTGTGTLSVSPAIDGAGTYTPAAVTGTGSLAVPQPSIMSNPAGIGQMTGSVTGGPVLRGRVSGGSVSGATVSGGGVLTGTVQGGRD